MTTTTADSLTLASTAARPRFYLWMSVAMAATAFIGFAPTFWFPLARGVPERFAVIAVHALLFFGWSLFVIYQAWLAASGKVARHRDVGLIGVSLATAMTIFGILTALNSSQRAIAAGYTTAAEAFLVVPLVPMLTFAVLMTAALVNLRRAEWHKRLVLSATAVLLDAAIARLFIFFVVMKGSLPPFKGTVGLAGLPGPPPPVAGLLPPAIIALLFVVAGMVYDRRTRGAVHPAYWWAGGFALAMHLVKIPVSDTALWHGFAGWLISLAG